MNTSNLFVGSSASNSSPMRHNYLFQQSPMHKSAAATQCSFDLLNAKVEHLEKERVQLSLQIQEQSEKDRTKKLRVDQLESDLKASENSQTNLNQVLQETREDLRISKESKEELFLVNLNLNERIEAQIKAAAEAQDLWSKMTAARRELKRQEEEILKLRQDKLDIEAEKDDFAKEAINLEGVINKQKEEMTLMRLEVEGQRLTFKDAKVALEKSNAITSDTLVSLHSTLDEERARNLNDKEKFQADMNDHLNEMEELRRELAARPPPTPLSNMVGIDEEAGQASFGALMHLKKKLLQSELKRKQLHNTLQELRGNIRVFVRCRPFLRGDCEEFIANENNENCDPNVSGCVRFHQDGSSVSLVAPVSARDKPQVCSICN
jgi:kinesin family protein C1